MRTERLVVIGGVAAGMSAASRARAVNPNLEVVVLEKGAYVSYGTCGLAYLVSGMVREPDDLLVYSPDYFLKQRGIAVFTRHEVLEIVPAKKHVLARRGEEAVPVEYDKLVIATGAAPAEQIAGSEQTGVFTCNDLAGALALRQFIVERRPRRGLVIGGGYIGLEVAEALRLRLLEVTVLERSGHLLEDMEAEIAQRVKERLAKHQVRLELNTAVQWIDRASDASLVVTAEGGRIFPADVVVLATGVVPRAELAARAGIETGPSGALRTDDRQQTNLPSIYAAGDCVETFHRVTGGRVFVPLGTTANKQGRVAGENAAGGNATFPGIVGTLVTKVFGLEVGRTGLSWEGARAAGFGGAELVALEAGSRAKYLEGKPLWVTLVADRTSGRLLGGQLAGEEGAARRVDVLATALAAQMTVADFIHLDLGYAPPFGPVYDPLLVAAWQALKQIGRRR